MNITTVSLPQCTRTRIRLGGLLVRTVYTSFILSENFAFSVVH